MSPLMYVPILRWKKAEKDALAALNPEVRKQITPLFEFIMPSPIRDKKEFKKVITDSRTLYTNRLPSAIKEINKCCTEGQVFIDVHLVDWDMRASTLKHILSSASYCRATIVPVTHIFPVNGTVADKQVRAIAVEYASKNGSGVCVRIDRISLDDAELVKSINEFTSANNLKPENIDLLIDLGVIDADDDAKTIADKLSKLPEINKWRSFIVTGGAFPKDLSNFEKHSHPVIPRYDWKLWNDLNNTPTLLRKPTYSDYTIQHPIHYGNVTNTNVSASIRYTNDSQWDVLRGEGLNNDNGPGHKQYIAHAQTLIKRDFFKGKDCCFGDFYTFERAQPENKNTGNPTTWLKAGINHHMTMVIKQSAKHP